MTFTQKKLVHKPQAIEKVITRANHPPTSHFPPPREREVNPSPHHHNSSLMHLALKRRRGVKLLVQEQKAPSLTIQEKRVSHNFLQILNLKGQNLPPSVVMSQYTLNGCPVPIGSIQYSPFFCAVVYFQMSLQETPGKSGDEPFFIITDKREEM